MFVDGDTRVISEPTAVFDRCFGAPADALGSQAVWCGAANPSDLEESEPYMEFMKKGRLYLNSGILIVQPSATTFRKALEMVPVLGDNTFPVDQDFLNLFAQHENWEPRRLDVRDSMPDWRLGTKEVRHYLAGKPWLWWTFPAPPPDWLLPGAPMELTWGAYWDPEYQWLRLRVNGVLQSPVDWMGIVLVFSVAVLAVQEIALLLVVESCKVTATGRGRTSSRASDAHTVTAPLQLRLLRDRFGLTRGELWHASGHVLPAGAWALGRQHPLGAAGPGREERGWIGTACGPSVASGQWTSQVTAAALGAIAWSVLLWSTVGRDWSPGGLIARHQHALLAGAEAQGQVALCGAALGVLLPEAVLALVALRGTASGSLGATDSRVRSGSRGQRAGGGAVAGAGARADAVGAIRSASVGSFALWAIVTIRRAVWLAMELWFAGCLAFCLATAAALALFGGWDASTGKLPTRGLLSDAVWAVSAFGGPAAMLVWHTFAYRVEKPRQHAV